MNIEEFEEFEEFEELDEDEFGQYEGQCQACDKWGQVSDIQLCEVCEAKVDRDMIRLRDWDYSVSAFGVAPERREALRSQVVKEFGEKLELIAEEPVNDKPVNDKPVNDKPVNQEPVNE